MAFNFHEAKPTAYRNTKNVNVHIWLARRGACKSVTHQKLIVKLGGNMLLDKVRQQMAISKQLIFYLCYLFLVPSLSPAKSASFSVYCTSSPSLSGVGLLLQALPWQSCVFYKHLTTSVQRTLFGNQNTIHLLPEYMNQKHKKNKTHTT